MVGEKYMNNINKIDSLRTYLSQINAMRECIDKLDSKNRSKNIIPLSTILNKEKDRLLQSYRELEQSLCEFGIYQRDVIGISIATIVSALLEKEYEYKIINYYIPINETTKCSQEVACITNKGSNASFETGDVIVCFDASMKPEYSILENSTFNSSKSRIMHLVNGEYILNKLSHDINDSYISSKNFNMTKDNIEECRDIQAILLDFLKYVTEFCANYDIYNVNDGTMSVIVRQYFSHISDIKTKKYNYQK